jgi:hypothetical protein
MTKIKALIFTIVFLFATTLSAQTVRNGSEIVRGSVTGGFFMCPETTAPTGIAGYDILYCDAASHQWKTINNAGTVTPFPSVTNQVTYSIPTNTDGVATNLSGIVCTPPATPGLFQIVYKPTTNTVVPSSCLQVGFIPDAAAGATVLYTDCFNPIYNPAAALSLPTPTTLNNSNCGTAIINSQSASSTITPVTWTISLNGATAGATAVIPAHAKCSLLVDQIASQQWDLDCVTIGVASGGSGIPYGAGAGAVNVMTVTTVPAVATNVAGTVVEVLPNLANTTTTPTLNVGGAGAMTILKQGSSGALIALAVGDYSVSAANIDYIFSSNGTNWVLLNPLTGQLGTNMYIDASGNLQCITSTSCSMGGTNSLGAVTTNNVRTSLVNAAGRNSNTVIEGGQDDSSGGDNILGVGIFRGGDQTAASGTGAAGSATFRPGLSTSTSGFMGLAWFEMGAFKGATITLWNVETITVATTATVSDAGSGATSVSCIALTVANPIRCAIGGVVPVNTDGTAVVGHTVCMSGTVNGQGHDSGGFAGCAVGTSIGIVYAITGTYNTPLGSTVTATGTLPLIMLKM